MSANCSTTTMNHTNAGARIRLVQRPREPASPPGAARLVPLWRSLDLVDSGRRVEADALGQLPCYVAERSNERQRGRDPVIELSRRQPEQEGESSALTPAGHTAADGDWIEARDPSRYGLEISLFWSKSADQGKSRSPTKASTNSKPMSRTPTRSRPSPPVRVRAPSQSFGSTRRSARSPTCDSRSGEEHALSPSTQSKNLAARMARWSAQHRRRRSSAGSDSQSSLFAINMTSPMKTIVSETSGPGESGRADTIL